MKSSGYLNTLILMLIFIINFTKSYSWDCLPPDDQNCPWQEATWSFTGAGCAYSQPYKYRVCNNKLEIEYRVPTKLGENCDVWTELTSWQYDFKSKPDETDLYLMINGAESYFGLNVQDCPTTTELVRYLKARCGVWVHCTYQIEPQTPDCEAGFDPLPNPNATEVSIARWQSCG